MLTLEIAASPELFARWHNTASQLHALCLRTKDLHNAMSADLAFANELLTSMGNDLTTCIKHHRRNGDFALANRIEAERGEVREKLKHVKWIESLITPETNHDEVLRDFRQAHAACLAMAASMQAEESVAIDQATTRVRANAVAFSDLFARTANLSKASKAEVTHAMNLYSEVRCDLAMLREAAEKHGHDALLAWLTGVREAIEPFMMPLALLEAAMPDDPNHEAVMAAQREATAAAVAGHYAH
ncbi:MAG: hypothetical protein O9296_01875 [Novosphingobium sp.]|nr:hypothetical protein [Novosphingobium sp.]